MQEWKTHLQDLDSEEDSENEENLENMDSENSKNVDLRDQEECTKMHKICNL